MLLDATLSNGDPLVKGRLGGIRKQRGAVADSVVGARIQPFWIEDEARGIEDTNFIVEQRFREFAVRDGLFVTGQQQYSGAAAVRLVVEGFAR